MKIETIELPRVKQSAEKKLTDFVTEIINYELYEDDIKQSNEYHITMMHVQRRMIDFMECNYSIDKNELYSVKMRCEEVLKYLDLIIDASYPNRYKILPNANK